MNRLPTERVTYDEKAIVRYMSSGQVETIEWSDIAEIAIQTTDGGPYAEDFFWVLMSTDNSKGCVVSNGARGMESLLARLQRLPGFENKVMLEALGSTRNARFVVWKRDV
jgi:hypothetical protein